MGTRKKAFGFRKVLATILAFTMMFSVVEPSTLFAAEDNSTTDYKLVDMNFNQAVTLPYSNSSTGVTATLGRDSSTANQTADYASSALKTTNWDGDGKYWQLDFSTANFENLTFDAAIRSSNTGPADFKVAYSTDGTNYVDLTETLTATTSLTAIETITLPELANNQESVSIRIYKVDDVSVKGETVASTGVSNINSIVVTGDSIDGTLPEILEDTTTDSNTETSETPASEETTATEETTSTPETSENPAHGEPGHVCDEDEEDAETSGDITSDATEDTAVSYADPISDEDIPEGAITIAEALQAEDGTEVTVIGQVEYKYGKNGSLNTTVLEDVIDGEVVGFQIYDSLSSYSVGEVVTVTGTMSTYGSVKQLQKPSGGSLTIEKIKDADAIGAQIVTLSELSENGENYISEYVTIKNVTLGTYSTSNTAITDTDGNSINIYQSAAFPDGIEAGDQANVYGVYSKYNTTYQLRNGQSADSFKGTGYEVDSSIQTVLAKWAGTSQFEGTTVYGDLYADNDFLDTDAKITLSTGTQPQYTNTSTSGTEYYIGSTGLAEGEYYQLEFGSDKYASMNLTFKLRSSNSGAKYYNVLYSTDGVNFSQANNISYTINSTTYDSDGVATNTSNSYSNMSQLEATASWQTYNVDLPDDAANAETVYLRIQVASSNSRIDGKTTGISTSYTCRLTGIEVTGSPIVSDTITGLVTATPDAGAAALNSEVTLASSTKDATIYYSLNGADYTQYDESTKPVLSELPATLTAYAVSDGKENSVKVTYAYTQAQVATVKGSPNGGSVKLDSSVKLSCETEGATIYYSTDDGETYSEYTEKIQLTQLPATIKAYASVDGYINSEVKTLSFTERENENYNVYFGQIHSHTSYSDGAGTAEQAFEYASTKVDDLDFLAVTDHSNYFDNDTSATITDGSASSEWEEGQDLADQYTSDTFVGIMGYEMTWSGGAPGHINTFNTTGFLSRNDTGYGNGSSTSLTNYYSALKTVTDSISQFNHPGTTFGDFYDFGYYDTEIDQLVTTIEVGNGEGAVGSSGYYPSYEYYTRALDKGWHLAPTNNQDNHKGNWGSANTARTVVLADSLTRDNIYDALRNMRVYSTEDSNLTINYTLNDEVMGTILEETPDSVEINVDLSDEDSTDTIGKVEVIVNGGLSVASETISSNEGSVAFTLSPDYSYYYIKVTEGDGDIAVTAPVWISDVDAAGVSEVSTSTTLQIQDEAIDISTEIYNNNETDMEISSIVYSIGDNTIKTLEGDELEAAGLSTITSQTTGNYTFDFTYDGVGSATVTVTVNAVMNGVEKVYTGKLELNYVSSNMVSKVIIDGTHNNDYVNGYYSGSINNLGSLAAGYYEQIQTITDEITAKDLEDCSLLIISAPAKQSGTTTAGDSYSPTNFDDDFIALVADYVKNGGKVVLCGIADYKDCSTSQTSTELNKLLEAMGATTRVNSDEMYDEENYSNQNYRLYFDDFNTDSAYLDGLVDGMTYSAYSGASVLLDEDAVASGQAEAIVYGHDTTYSIDSKSYDDNYVEVEKGNIVAIAHENVGENGGGVWVGGTVFVSDYDVDESVNTSADDLSYANTVIASNILKECQKELEVTDIATVRKAEEGDIFTIEGYVTAGTTDVATTFFDSIYVQDDTAGIDIFPFSETGVEIGQKIRITGYVDSYQGDRELQVMSYEILDGSKVYEPQQVTTAEATDYDAWGGSLIQVSGTITDVEYAESVLNYIYVEDESGVSCKILTDGYIGSSTGESNITEIAQVGNKITAAGILYMNPQGACIRTRDLAEIVLVEGAEEETPETPVTSTIKYYLGGGTNASSNPSTYVEGTAVKLTNPTKTGYTFAGWYTDSSYTTKLSSNKISTSTTGNLKLYAKWTANKYTIKFSKNSTSASGSVKSVSATYGTSVKLTANSFTRKGYVFAGWATSASGKVVYSNKASVKNLTATAGKTVTLYAKWTKVSVAKTTLSTVKTGSSSKSIKVTWKKVSDVAGYQITYSTSKNFKNAKTVTVSKSSLTKTLTGLNSGTTYYVKVRAYKKDSKGNNVYGTYSAVKKAVAKKQ